MVCINWDGSCDLRNDQPVSRTRAVDMQDNAGCFSADGTLGHGHVLRIHID